MIPFWGDIQMAGLVFGHSLLRSLLYVLRRTGSSLPFCLVRQSVPSFVTLGPPGNGVFFQNNVALLLFCVGFVQSVIVFSQIVGVFLFLPVVLWQRDGVFLSAGSVFAQGFIVLWQRNVVLKHIFGVYECKIAVPEGEFGTVQRVFGLARELRLLNPLYPVVSSKAADVC